MPRVATFVLVETLPEGLDEMLVSADRIGTLENGSVAGRLDIYVRIAGSLSVTLDDLLAGVTSTAPY